MNFNVKHAKNGETDFGVLKQVGNFSKEAEQTNVSLTGDMSVSEFSNFDDSKVVFDEKLGKVSVKERLSLKRILSNLNQKRREGHHDLTIDGYLKGAGYVKNNGENFTIADIYRQMGFNPKRHTINFILNTARVEGSRELVPEIIRGFLEKDLVEEGIWRSLIAGERMVAQPRETVPHINYTGELAAMEEIGEASHIPLGKVSFGRKDVELQRRGIGIAITDPVKKYVTVDQLGIYFRDVTRRMNNDLTGDLLNIIQNGDNPNSTDPIGSMGVDTIANKIQYIDYLRLMIHYARAGYNPASIVMNADEALRQLQQAEFKPSANNTAPRFNLALGNSGMADNATIWIHDDIADEAQMFLDPRFTAEYLVAEPLMVEQERKGSVETDFYYARMTSGFSNLIQAAKVLMDGTLAFSATGFPSYLNLKK